MFSFVDTLPSSFHANSDCIDRARTFLELCLSPMLRVSGFWMEPRDLQTSAVTLFPNKATWEGRVPGVRRQSWLETTDLSQKNLLKVSFSLSLEVCTHETIQVSTH